MGVVQRGVRHRGDYIVTKKIRIVTLSANVPYAKLLGLASFPQRYQGLRDLVTLLYARIVRKAVEESNETGLSDPLVPDHGDRNL